MKIRRIKIKRFYHLEELDIDLTYPKGHPKAGQAMDKVCFIGQSGTGKTTFLEIIAAVMMCERSGKGFQNTKSYVPVNEATIEYEVDDRIITAELSTNPSEKLPYTLTRSDHNFIAGGGGFYVPTPHFSPKKELDRIRLSGLHQLLLASTEGQPQLDDLSKYGRKLSMIVTANNLSEIVEPYFHKILAHQQAEILFRAQLTEQLEEDPNIDIPKEVKIWKASNPDPTDDFSELVNPIIERFALQISKKISDFPPRLSFVHQLTQKSVDYDQISAGTRQIIKNILPVHFLTPQFENNTFLIDEPESGLYPDVQREIVSHYTQAAHHTQFFFATHSPIIASSFEPWEIVELKFNAAIGGVVYQDKYYKGERHVNNYQYDPRYLEYGTVLSELFDVSPINELGDKKLEDFAKLKAELETYTKAELQHPNGDETLKKKIEAYKELRRQIDPTKYGRKYA